MRYVCPKGHELDSDTSWIADYIYNEVLQDAECMPCPWCLKMWFEKNRLLMQPSEN